MEMYGSPTMSKDLNLPFPSLQLKHGKDEPDHQQKREHEMNLSGLLRYRSSPNTLVGDVCDETAAAESMFARFMSPNLRGNMSGGGDGEKQPQQQQKTEGEAEVVAASSGFHSSGSPSPRMFFHSSLQLQRQQSNQHISSANPGVVEASCGSSSSPAAAGNFCHINVPNGFSDSAMTNNSRRSSMGRHQLNFSPTRGTTNLIPQISEMDDGVRSYIPVPAQYPGVATPLWEDPTGIGLSDGFSSGNRSESLHGQSSLAQHYSLPKSAATMSAMERNILQFQDVVPCKIRAKRGCATHPRSIAERVRRTRISERMRKLQQLVPNMDKQTNTAEMLDLALDYIKDLQMQTKLLSERRKKCSCSNQC